jgi:hypothetical protein
MGFFGVRRPPDGSVVYNCCWSSPVQSCAELMTIFYCLRFETTPIWTVRSPYLYLPGRWWPSYTPRHLVPFSWPPTTQGYGGDILTHLHAWALTDSRNWTTSPRCTAPARIRFFHYYVFSRYRGNNVSTEMFPGSGCCTVAYLHSCYLAVAPNHTSMTSSLNKLKNSLYNKRILLNEIMITQYTNRALCELVTGSFNCR